MTDTLTADPLHPKSLKPDPLDIEAPVTAHQWLYWSILGVVGYGFYYLGSQLTGIGYGPFNIGYLVWVAGILYFIAGIKPVGPEELVGVQFLQIPTIVATGWPIIALPGLFTFETRTRSTIQMELPDEPENIFRNEDVQPVPEGKVPPIRITFAPSDPTSPQAKDDPLSERVTAEMSVFVRFRIRDFWSFYVRINNLEEARRQLHDMAVSVLQERLAKLTAAQALAKQEEISDELDNLIRIKTANWGIELIDARLKLPGFSHSLNKAISGMAESAANKRSAIITSEGEQIRLTNEGVGRAKAVQAELEARGKGLKAMAETLGVDGADVLGAETARNIGESPSNTTIVGLDGFKELLALGKVMAGSTKSTPTPKD